MPLPVSGGTGGMEQGETMSAPNYYYYKGKYYTLTDLAMMSGVNYCTLQSRFRTGWSVEKAINTPSKGHKYYKYDGKLYTVTDLPLERLPICFTMR